MWIFTLFLISDAMLFTPGQIRTWQNTWVQSGISLSSNNASAQDVTFTFNLNVSTNITSGVVKMTFPDGFSLASAGCDTSLHIGCVVSVANNVISISNITLLAGVDSKLVITSVQNSSTTGGHGPFAITTKHFLYGQIVDQNIAFGTIGLVEPIGDLTELGIAIEGSNLVGSTGNRLKFEFTINTDLWKHDLFHITIDSSWTVDASTVCESLARKDKINNFNGTHAEPDIHLLDCEVSEKQADISQELWVYGLANDINISTNPDNKYACLQISHATNPDRKYDEATYLWSIETMRFQTANILGRGKITGQPTIQPAQIITASYSPTWQMNASEIVSGVSIFMDVSFDTINAIPAGGQARVELSEDVSISSWAGVNWYYKTLLSETVSGVTYTASCAASGSNSIVVSNLPNVQAWYTISFRVLALFNGLTGQFTSATTSINGLTIDQSTGSLVDLNLASVTQASLATAFSIILTNEAGTSNTQAYSGGEPEGSYDYYFKIHWQPSIQITGDTTVTVSCPLDSHESEWGFYISNATGFAAKYREDGIDLTSGTDMDDQGGNLALPTRFLGGESELGSFSWELNKNSVSNYPEKDETQTVGIYRSSGDQLAYPRVATNAASVHECRFEAKNSAQISIRSAFHFTILGSDWISKTFSAYTCLDSSIGMVYKTTITPKKMDFPVSSSSITYFIDIEFDIGTDANTQSEMLGSGLSDGDVFPVICEDAMTDTTMTATIMDGTKDVIRISNFGKFDSTNTANCYFPLGANGTGTASVGTFGVIIQGGYLTSSDSRYEQIMYVSQATVSTSTASSNSWQLFNDSGYNIDQHVGGSIVENYQMEHKIGATVSSSIGDIFQVVMPKGYTISDISLLKHSVDGNAQLTERKLFSSTKRSFTYPTVTGTISTDDMKFSSTATTISRILYVNTDYGYYIDLQTYSYTGNASAACIANGSFTYTALPDYIDLGSIEPRSINGRGPDSTEVTLEIQLWNNAGFIQGGAAQLQLDSLWTTTSSTSCSVSVLESSIPGYPVVCLIDGQNLNIANYQTNDGSDGFTFTITIEKIQPPINNGSTSISANVINSMIITDDGGIVIGTYFEQSLTEDITILPSVSQGSSTFNKIATFPMTADEADVDLELTFSLAHTLPSRGIIQITSPFTFSLQDGSSGEQCWANLKFSSCSVSSTVLSIEIGEPVSSGFQIELYIDKALSTPSTNLSNAQAFTIQTTWESIEIDKDPTTSSEIPASHTFNFLPGVKSSIGLLSMTNAPTTEGELADYTIEFTILEDIAETDYFIVQFPRQFSASIAEESYTLSLNASEHYVACNSTILGASIWTAEHWMLTIHASRFVEQVTTIQIQIFNVYNPAAGETDYFAMYHYGIDEGLKARNRSLSKVVTTEQPSRNIIVRNFSASNHELTMDEVQYSFDLYSTGTLNSETDLMIRFPNQYDLTLNGKTNGYACNTELQTDKGIEEWNTSSICNSSNDMISLNAETNASEVTVQSDSYIHWDISGIKNPEWGTTRVPQLLWDFDATDSEIWTEYPVWTSQFDFFVYDNSTQSYISKTHQNTQSNYLGFSYSQKLSIKVNDFDSATETNRIIVTPGTQSSNISISVNDFWTSEKIILSPTAFSSTAQDLFKFTSTSNQFTMYQDEQEIYFQIGTSISTPIGLYYISWSLDEISQVNGVKKYKPPSKTIIEVAPKSQYAITVETLTEQAGGLLDIPIGRDTMPIRVTVPLAPASEVSVNIQVSSENGPGISVSPSIVTFVPSITEQTFKISVSSTFDSTNRDTQVLLLSLTGTDAEVYTITPTYEFQVAKITTTKSGYIYTWGIQSWTRTTCSFAPQPSQEGTIYYSIGHSGGECSSFLDLYSDIQSQTQESIQSAQQSPETDETWIEFQNRIYSSSLGSKIIGYLPFANLHTSHIISASGLWASSHYQICGYLENIYGFISEVSYGFFTTEDMHESQEFTVTLQGQVSQEKSDVIRQQVAYYQGVNPLRVKETAYSAQKEPEKRNLQDGQTTFNFILYGDRARESPSTSAIATLSSDETSSLKSALLPLELISVANVSSLPRITPTWKRSPTLLTTGNNFISMTGQASIEGQTCCIADVQPSRSIYPTHEQIYYLKNWNFEDSPGVCVDSNASADNVITISGLAEITQYTVYCTATDNFPLWPTLMENDSQNPITAHKATTTSLQNDLDDDVDVSFAIWFM